MRDEFDSCCDCPSCAGPLVGSKLPEADLDVYHNGEILKIKLSAYQGKWLVLFFYPADFTFVCPTELKELADLYPKFQELGAEVISVSTDTAFSHKAWHDSSPAVGKVTFPMAADHAGSLAEALGIYLQDEGLSLRGTFIVSPEGIIKTAEVHDNGIGRSAAETLRKLQAAQFVASHGGEVCPASWIPGGTTLKPGADLVGKL